MGHLVRCHGQFCTGRGSFTTGPSAISSGMWVMCYRAVGHVLQGLVSFGTGLLTYLLLGRGPCAIGPRTMCYWVVGYVLPGCWSFIPVYWTLGKGPVRYLVKGHRPFTTMSSSFLYRVMDHLLTGLRSFAIGQWTICYWPVENLLLVLGHLLLVRGLYTNRICTIWYRAVDSDTM